MVMVRRDFGVAEVVAAHGVLGKERLLQSGGRLGLAGFAVALPRLVDADGSVGQIDVTAPQCSDLAEPEARAGSQGEQVAILGR